MLVTNKLEVKNIAPFVHCFLSNPETNYFQPKKMGYSLWILWCHLWYFLNLITSKSKTKKIRTKPALLFSFYQNKSEELWLTLSLHSGKHTAIKHKHSLHLNNYMLWCCVACVQRQCLQSSLNPRVTKKMGKKKWNSRNRNTSRIQAESHRTLKKASRCVHVHKHKHIQKSARTHWVASSSHFRSKVKRIVQEPKNHLEC